MMATVRDLCTNSLKNLGLEGLVNDGVPNEEITDALRHLNHLVNYLEAQRLWDPVQTEQTVTTSGAYINVGPIPPTVVGIDNVITNKVPSRIRSASVTEGTRIFPMTELSETEYLAYTRSTSKGSPRYYIWKPISGSYGELLLYPNPASPETITFTYNQLTAGAYVLNDTLDLKPGYEAYLEYALTVRLGKPMAIDVSQWITLEKQYYQTIRLARTQQSYMSQGDISYGKYDVDSDTYR